MRVAPAALVLSLAAACGKPSPSNPAPEATRPMDLVGTEWRLDDLAGMPVRADAPVTLSFLPDGRVAGRASCNRYSGSVRISGASMTFGPMASTMMACDDAIMEQERAFLAALAATDHVEVDAATQTLRLHGKDSDRPLHFIRVTGGT